MLGGVPFAGSVAGPWLLVLGMVGLAFLVIPISEYRMRAGNIEGRQEVLNSLLGRLNGSIKGIQTLKDASKYEKILKELAEAKNAADSKIAALKVEKVAKGSCLRSVSLFFGACVRGKAASTGSSDQNAALVESRFLC